MLKSMFDEGFDGKRSWRRRTTRRHPANELGWIANTQCDSSVSQTSASSGTPPLCPSALPSAQAPPMTHGVQKFMWTDEM
ncbi:hypothetical protein Aduo_009035 [Ancylostoma duodenale]